LRDDDNGFDSGSAYLFNIGTGGLLGKMLASNGTMNDLFAKDVAIDGDSILIGALFHDVPTTDAGTAFVFSVRPDCNENGIPDARDIAVGTSSDNDGDGIPDECGTTSAYCFGDGSGQPCPCGNSGATGEGCLNSGNQGGLAFTVGSTRVSADDLLIAASRLIPGQPAILFSGMHSLNGGAGLPFGDGLRCVGGSVRRLGVRLPDSAGTALWGPGLAASGGWGPGDSRYLQCWYSDPQGPCGSTVNLSNGVSVTLQP
jgi:hypothetical protein